MKTVAGVIGDLKVLIRENKKTLIIVREISGSGKSTFANLIKKNCVYWSEHNGGFSCTYPNYYEADQFFYKKYGEYKWNKDELTLAHEWCRKSVECDMMIGNPVVVSNTFIKQWEMEPYITLCERWNYNWVVIRLNTEYDNIHNVPQETIDTMKTRIEDISGEWVIE